MNLFIEFLNSESYDKNNYYTITFFFDTKKLILNHPSDAKKNIEIPIDIFIKWLPGHLCRLDKVSENFFVFEIPKIPIKSNLLIS